MDKILRPARFDSDPNSANAARDFRHWFKTFTNYLNELAALKLDKVKTLANSVSSNVYEYIDGIDVYEDAIALFATAKRNFRSPHPLNSVATAWGVY